MLKLKVEDLNSVDEQYRELYEERDGTHHLKVDGIEDTGALKRAKDHERKARREAEEKLKELEFENDKLTAQMGDIDPGEMATLKAQVKKYEGEITGLTETLEGERGARVTENRDARISAIAKDKTTAPSAAAAFLRENLRGEYVDGTFQLTPVGPDGQPTGQTEAEFVESFVKNEEFAGIIKASQGSGGGANGARSGSNGAGSGPMDYTGKSTKEIAQHLMQKKAAQ